MNFIRNTLTKLKSNYCELETIVVKEPYFTFDRKFVYLDGYEYKIKHQVLHRKYVSKHIILKSYREVVYSESDLDLNIAYEFYGINKEPVNIRKV